MSEFNISRENRPLPQQCALHEEALKELQSDMRQTRIAVCGDERIGVKGLVRDMEDLKAWRRQMDLRVAGIAGGVSVLAAVAKWVFTRI